MNTSTLQPHKRQLTGVVVSKSGSKTVCVQVVQIAVHPLYGKRMKRTKKYLAHDTSDGITVGERVTIQECRPMSARKRWIVLPGDKL